MSELTSQDLWSALTAEEKNDACLAFWEAKDHIIKEAHAPILQKLAAYLRFRLVFLQKKNPQERSAILKRFIDKPDFHKFHDDVLRGWLLTKKSDLLGKL